MQQSTGIYLPLQGTPANPVFSSWDNILLLVEFLQPNKSDALAYLDSNSKRPDRYARARIQFGATLEPYIQEFMVGPLPVTNGTTSVQPLNYIFNKGEGRFNAYGIDTTALLAYLIQVAGEVSDITQRLFNAVSKHLLLNAQTAK